MDDAFFDADRLDDAIHGRLRLAIMAFLSGVEYAQFTDLKSSTKATDGNLSVHLRKLEEAGYVEVQKGYAGRKPQTTLRLTDAGRKAWIGYLDEMRKLLSQINVPS